MPSRSFRLHGAMERMEAGEDLYMGFSTDFAEKNKQLRDDIEDNFTSLAPLQKASKLFMTKIVEVQEETASMNQAQVELEVRDDHASAALTQLTRVRSTSRSVTRVSCGGARRWRTGWPTRAGGSIPR